MPTPEIALSPDLLETAAARLAKAIGADAVLLADDRIAEFRDPYGAPGSTDYQPSFVVQPCTVEEVQAVLAIANELVVPVWTNSQGRNYGYGGGAPIISGSIVLNLRRMNKILEINEDAGYALIEPGVQFFDLYEAIKRQGAKLMMSVPDLGWGSMTGNLLEHGVGATTLADHAGAVCGMEVVLADGTVIRTGMGAAEGSTLWNRHKRGFGPMLDPIFMQSNFGVVTKVGIWLTPQPETIITGSVAVEAEEGIKGLIDAIRPLVLDGTIQGFPLIASSPLPEDGRATPFDDTSSSSKLRKLSALQFPGRWYCRIGFYGHHAVVQAQADILRQAVADMPTAQVELRTYRGDQRAQEFLPQDFCAAGIPNMEMLNLLHAHFGDTTGHVDFSAVIPFDGESAAKQEALVQHALREAGLVGAFAWLANPRSLIGVCMILFDTRDADEAAAAYRVAIELAEKARKLGWNEYRGHPALIEHIVGTYDFNDHAIYKAYGLIKDALDPNGILSPGNHGIWPSACRVGVTPSNGGSPGHER